MPLDYDFEPYGPIGHRTLSDFERTDKLAELRLGAEKLLHDFEAVMPSLYDRGLMSREEVEAKRHELRAIAADMVTDHERRETLRAWLKDSSKPEPRPIDQLLQEQDIHAPWAAKVEALRAVIIKRRDSFADNVNKGLTTEAEATATLERLEAIHARYWLDGFGFDGSTTDLRAHIEALRGVRKAEDIAA